MERIGSIWTMIVRYLLLVMFGGVIVWACNSAGISVYAEDFSLIFMKEKNTITDSGLTEMGQGQRQKSLVRHMSGHLIRLFIMTLQVVRSRITVRQQQAEEGCLRQGEMVKSLKPGRIKERTKENLRQTILCMGRVFG